MTDVVYVGGDALHEAAHAVAALDAQLPLAKVHLGVDGLGHGGFAEIPLHSLAPFSPRWRGSLRGWVRMLLAGWAIDVEVTGKRESALKRSLGDRDDIRDLYGRIGLPVPDLTEYEAAALKWVRRRRKVIELVAVELEKRRTLSPRDVRRLIKLAALAQTTQSRQAGRRR